MARIGGNPGNKGGGRLSYGLELKVSELKGMLLIAVLDDCKANPERKLYWAEKFVNKLMPQEIAGTGEGGAINIKQIIISACDDTKRETKD